MKDRVWIIGSSPECDVRVESETVSGRHCRLMRRGREFVIEDLASTNGVFVAGEKVQGPRLVRRGEAIVLGRDVAMPWPDLSSITIGRLPENDIMIPLDMVSGRHARVEREGSRVFIVDLGSTNGVSLNDPLNKVRRAAIRPGDVVFLGTHRVAAAELLAELPEQETSGGEAHRGTRLEASPLAGLMAKPQPGPGGDASPRSAADRGSLFRSPLSWAIGVALSAVLVLLTVGASVLIHGSASATPSSEDLRKLQKKHMYLERKAKESAGKSGAAGT